MSGSDTVLRDDTEGVCVLTLHRPERNNAWTLELEERYFELLIDAAADPAVRVVVVTGSGKSFCPGADSQVLAAVAGGAEISSQPRFPHFLTRHIPKPVIAAINGACAGVGLVQALMCDLRFMSRTAKLTTAFSRRGLPAENAMAWLLTRLAGSGVAADLLLSGRPITGDEALQLGIVNRAVEPEELLATTLAYAGDLAANCSPYAMAEMKRELYESLEIPMEEAWLESRAAFAAAREQPDFEEGVASFVEKRSPSFAGLSVTIDPDEARR